MKTAAELVRSAKEKIQEISSPEIVSELAAGRDLVLIDVREPEEYLAGHIPGAASIPRGVLEFQVAAHPALACDATAPELAQLDRTIYVYCRSGFRSALAALSLKEMGFSSVKSLAGGFMDWSAHGFEVEK